MNISVISVHGGTQYNSYVWGILHVYVHDWELTGQIFNGYSHTMYSHYGYINTIDKMSKLSGHFNEVLYV